MDKQIIDIDDREADYKSVTEDAWRAEVGIRAIWLMYDEHTDDKNSYDNVLLLKENIQYRIFSAAHHYLIFLRELGSKEEKLKQLFKEDPNMFTAYPLGNPHLEHMELELSSVFDSVIFQLSSVFDYISHAICYMFKTDKSNTLYWTKLMASARDPKNELSKLSFSSLLQDIDRQFVGKLYDYRSRLIHHKRDRHQFATTVELNSLSFRVKIISSEVVIKHFKSIRKEVPVGDITLTYISSWLVKQSFKELERLLNGIRSELLANSKFSQNLGRHKSAKSFFLLIHDPKTNTLTPSSEGIWNEYVKRGKGKHNGIS